MYSFTWKDLGTVVEREGGDVGGSRGADGERWCWEGHDVVSIIVPLLSERSIYFNYASMR